ncbi:MAG: hypothetical protein IKQ56_03855 [Lachnospiraceae bacterium]|nr:hypothetical protein [Lachnospiraceae bacterium]
MPEKSGKYLYDNGFTIYVVSGTERTTTRAIGKRPVLAFGNSGSDTSMMNYTIDSRNPYPAMAYMIVADDSEREWGSADWETKSADYREQGYVPVSMKNDFLEIYPDKITKNETQN